MSVPGPSRPWVILAEGDPELANAIEFMLRAEGFQVAVCRSGDDLLGLDLPEGATCLLIDERLADGAGLAALAALRARGVRAPALVMTERATRLRPTAAEAQAQVLEKPVLGQVLVQAVLDALRV